MSGYRIVDWREGEAWALLAPDGRLVGIYLSRLSAEAELERIEEALRRV